MFFAKLRIEIEYSAGHADLPFFICENGAKNVIFSLKRDCRHLQKTVSENGYHSRRHKNVISATAYPRQHVSRMAYISSLLFSTSLVILCRYPTAFPSTCKFVNRASKHHKDNYIAREGMCGVYLAIHDSNCLIRSFVLFNSSNLFR